VPSVAARILESHHDWNTILELQELVMKIRMVPSARPFTALREAYATRPRAGNLRRMW